VFNVTQPDDCLSAPDAKELAQDQINDLPLPGIEGRALNPGDIWPVVTRAAADRGQRDIEAIGRVQHDQSH